MLKRLFLSVLLVSVAFLTFTSPASASMKVTVTEVLRPTCYNEDIWETVNNQILVYNHINASQTATYTSMMEYTHEGAMSTACADPEYNNSPDGMGIFFLASMGANGSDAVLTQADNIHYFSNYEITTQFYCEPGETTEGCDGTEQPPEESQYSCEFCQLITYTPHDFPARNISEVVEVYSDKFPFDFFNGFNVQAANLECPVFTVGNRSMPLCSLKRLIDVIIIMLPMFLFGNWLFKGS